MIQPGQKKTSALFKTIFHVILYFMNVGQFIWAHVAHVWSVFFISLCVRVFVYVPSSIFDSHRQYCSLKFNPNYSSLSSDSFIRRVSRSYDFFYEKKIINKETESIIEPYGYLFKNILLIDNLSMM